MTSVPDWKVDMVENALRKKLESLTGFQDEETQATKLIQTFDFFNVSWH